MIKQNLQTVQLTSLPETSYIVGRGACTCTPSIVLGLVGTPYYQKDQTNVIGYEISSLDSPAGRKFWEIKPPIRPFQTLRGLKLLFECPRIEDDTLCACYYAASRELDETARHYIRSLKDSGFDNIEECRAKLLEGQSFNPALFESFLRRLDKNRISIDADELKRETGILKSQNKRIRFPKGSHPINSVIDVV